MDVRWCLVMIVIKHSYFWCEASEDRDFCSNRTDGYYPNPTDCHSYYNCANQLPGYSPCPEGLVYDQSLQNCVNGECIAANTSDATPPEDATDEEMVMAVELVTSSSEATTSTAVYKSSKLKPCTSLHTMQTFSEIDCARLCFHSEHCNAIKFTSIQNSNTECQLLHCTE